VQSAASPKTLTPGAPSLERIEVVQPVLFSVHVALAELWLANGLVAQAVIGQSQREIAAACVAGALSLEDAMLVIVGRSQLFAEELIGRGGIASIGLAERELIQYLKPYAGKLEIAGIIGSRTATVAGDLTGLKDLVAQLKQLGIAAKLVPASIPSHCAFIEPVRERLGTALRCVRPRPSHIPIYSTVTAEAVRGDELTADYRYQRNFRWRLQPRRGHRRRGDAAVLRFDDLDVLPGPGSRRCGRRDGIPRTQPRRQLIRPSTPRSPFVARGVAATEGERPAFLSGIIEACGTTGGRFRSASSAGSS
jgi:acyl transferase domain-containing protein